MSSPVDPIVEAPGGSTPDAGSTPGAGRVSADRRSDALIDLSSAASLVKTGMTVGLSGFAHQNPPMAIVRELIRRGVRDLTLVSGPTSGIETDMLIGAGCVSRLISAGVALEGVAGIAPAFRHRSERGELEVWECDECIWYIALRAAAWGVPWLLWPGGVGTSLPDLNPDLEEVIVDGRSFLRVGPVRPDVVFVHASEADRFGNVRVSPRAYLGRSFAERALAEACAGPVIATVERIVDNDEVVAEPEWTQIWGARVVHAPNGAYPGGVSGMTPPDLDELRAYAAAGSELLRGNQSKYHDYVEAFVQPGGMS